MRRCRGGPACLDARLGAAVRAMHADLYRPRTVASLADECNLSRSVFAATFKRFKRVTAETPLEYLTAWRMYRAKMLLRGSEHSLGEIAQRVGYETDTALSRAFRRWEGIAPGQWRRHAGRELD